MLRLAFKSVKHNPKRLILTAIAVALGVSLVAATHIFTNSLSTGFSSLFSEIYESVDVVVEPDPEAETDTADNPAERAPGVASAPFSAQLLDDVRAVDGVTAAGGGVAVESLALLNSEANARLNPSGAPTLIYNWTGIPEIDRSTVIEGRAVQAPGEAVIDVDTFALGDFSLGDEIAIAAEDGVATFDLVGTVRFGEDNSLQTANLIFMSADDVRMLGGDLEGWQLIEVVTADGADNEAIAEDIDTLLPEGTRAITAEAKAAEQTAAFGEVLQYVDIFALAFAIIALFVGAYIIVNTFRIIVTQRTREFGLLRAIGVTGKQIRSVILLEGLIVGLVASAIGILSGWLLALVIVGIVELGTGELFGTVVLPIDAIVWGFGVGLLVTTISALLPAIHASTISPMEALRESSTQSKKSLTLRNIVGGAMALTGVLLLAIGLFADVERAYVWVGAGAILLVLGATLLAAQVLVPIAYGMRRFLTALFGVDGKLAANNIHREPRRSANTAAALMIGVMLLALVATFTESLKSTFTDQFEGNEAELFVIATDSEIPLGAVDVINDTEGVAATSRFTFGEVTVDGDSRQLGVIDAEEADGLLAFPTEPGIGELGEGVFIDPTLQESGYEVGDSITVSGDAGTVDLEVTGLFLTEGDANVFVDWETAESIIDDLFLAQVIVDFEEAADVDATKEAVQENLSEGYPLVQVQEPSEIQQFFNNFIDLLLGVISALLGSALVIAILGVANTQLLSVTERTREIGLLRAVGMRRSSVWRMITVESMVMALFGTVLGMILGVSLGSALVLSLEEFGFSGVTIPWMWLAIYTVLAAIAGILAAIWPAWRASRLDILQAIATE